MLVIKSSFTKVNYETAYIGSLNNIQNGVFMQMQTSRMPAYLLKYWIFIQYSLTVVQRVDCY